VTSLRTDKIYLVGFMGSGKSTLARALGRRLGWPVVDLDSAIEQREGQPVSDIFARKGEAYFRKVEREVLLSVRPQRHVVVATGGGTFVQPANRADIKADGVSVWLDVPFRRILQRVPSDGRRPLAANRETFEALFAERRAAYQMADIRLDADTSSVDALVEQLLDRLGW
jgi:shikimate kinase